MDKKVMTLWELDSGSQCTVESFQPGIPDNYRKRLAVLGFQPGQVVSSVLAPNLGAPRLYRVANTVYSLDDQIARYIHVAPQPSQP